MAPKSIVELDEVIAAYKELLLKNPGKALVIFDGGVACLEEGHVFGAYLSADGTNQIETDFDFDSRSFMAEGCWDGETPEQTMDRIQNPTFVEILPKS